MKKVFASFLIAFFIATPIFARTISYRAVTKTGTFACDRVYWGKTGATCYVGTKSKGIGTLQEWTGLYDTTGKKIYEGDTVIGTNIPSGIVMWGYRTLLPVFTYLGWVVYTPNGSNYFLLGNSILTVQ